MEKYLKNKKIRLDFKEDIEPHEILLDNLAKKKEEEWGHPEQKMEVPLRQRAIWGFFYLSAILLLGLFLRSLQLLVVEGKEFSEMADKNRYISSKIQAERGVIYDRNLKQLVYNRSSFDLFLSKDALPESDQEKDEVLSEVSQIVKISPADLENMMAENSGSQFAVAENIDYQTLIVLESKIDQLPGFEIKESPSREYWQGEIFSHLMGYTGKINGDEAKAEPEFYSLSDYVGRDGLEKYYEKTLRRNPGSVKIERDVKGNVISKEVSSLPESGKNLVLWLDADLQIKVAEEVKKEMEVLGIKKATAVAMDPDSGGILSLVSFPAYDNNVFSRKDSEAIQSLFKDKNDPLYDRVIRGQYPTGSTIKPLIATAALEEKIISPEKVIEDPGYITVPHRYNPEIIYTYLDWKTHGWADMRKAIAVSCNVYFYTIGGGYGSQQGLGPTKIKKYLELFGWGNYTGIDLPGEEKGLIPSPAWKEEIKGESWVDGDTYHFSIGQGDLLATPLQVVASFAAIANGGKLLQPQAAQKIIDDEKNVIEEINPLVIRSGFADSGNLQVVREGMRQAVTSDEGSSHMLISLPVAAASKTGTAETGRENIYNNWVTVFAPYENPQIVLTIMLENVEGMQAAALPVARNILEWYFTR